MKISLLVCVSINMSCKHLSFLLWGFLVQYVYIHLYIYTFSFQLNGIWNSVIHVSDY